MDKPETSTVRAGDVKPYEWGVWCRVEGGEPFVNEIVARRTSEDGAFLWFMLDSHNFLKAAPDDMIELVPMKKASHREQETE